MLQLNGKTLQYDRAFTHEGISYPANWLRLTTLEEKQAIGIVEIIDQPEDYWDQRFYWGVDNPKDLDQLKSLWKQTQSETAGLLLAPSDWRVIKARETGVKLISIGLTTVKLFVQPVTHVKLKLTTVLMSQHFKNLLTTLLLLGLKNHDHPYPSNSFFIP